MKKSSPPNFRSTTNFIACRAMTMPTNMITSTHVAIVRAFDLLVEVIGAARMAIEDVEGIHISN